MAGGKNPAGNFCKKVRKLWRAGFHIRLNIRNMITGMQLPSQSVGQSVWSVHRQHAWAARQGSGLGIRIRDSLWAFILARVPMGYEDETGFHYETMEAVWSFTI